VSTVVVLIPSRVAICEWVKPSATYLRVCSSLYISPKTVEQHVARLRQKLDATNRAELVAALRAKLAR
jgi:DNA-binding CsgD family transcriptional regulator